MADALTKPQSDVDRMLLELTDNQRTFQSNYGESLLNIRRAIFHEVAIATTAGLVLGGLVGVIVGQRRR
jgi:hypothetical protein